LIAVIGGPSVHALGYTFAFYPVLLNALTILAVAVVALIFAQTKRWPFVARAVPAICLSALAGFTLIESVMLGLQRQRDKATQHTAAVITDFPARWWEKWTGTGHGSVKCDIVFSGSEPGYIEPLIATSFDRDLIYVVRDDQTHLRFGFFHEGSGGPIGNPVEIQPGKKYRIEIDLGSLYPPNEHPAYRGWDESLIDALARADASLITAGGFRLVGGAIRVDGYEPSYAAAPRLGEHGDLGPAAPAEGEGAGCSGV